MRRILRNIFLDSENSYRLHHLPRKVVGFLLIGFLVLVPGVVLYSTEAQAYTPAPTTVRPTANPEDIVPDYECINKQVLGLTGTVTRSLFYRCSKSCPRKCLYAKPDFRIRIDGFCLKAEYTDEYYCDGYDSSEVPLSSSLDKINILNVEVDRSILILFRRAILLVMGGAGLIIIGFGLFATYKYSMSEGNQEKVQEAMKIFKGLIIGAIITFSGVLFIQISALVTGVTGSLFDFNFMPRTGRVIYLYETDIGTTCFLEQKASTELGSMKYMCDPVELVWK